MRTCLEKGNRWLNSHMFVVVLGAMLVGFIFPLHNSPELRIFSIILFAYMTLVTALTTSLKDFVRIVSSPLIPVWILCLIHGIVPLFAWILGSLLYPDDFYMRVGLLIASSIPIAVTSIIWTSISNGDVALSLVAVTLDTLIIPVLMPTYIAYIVGKSIQIDYTTMLLQLVAMVTVPSFLGMTVNQITRGRFDDFARSAGGFTAKIANFIVIFLNAAVILPEIHWDKSITKTMAVVFVVVLIGYACGLLGSLILGKRRRETVVSMIFNVGMRNTSFGSVLAIAYFPPTVAIPVTLIMLYQQPVAAIVSHLLNRRGRETVDC